MMLSFFRHDELLRRLSGYLALATLLSTPSIVIAAATPALPYSALAEQLGWIARPISPNALCDGYFTEPKAIADFPIPPAYQETPIHLTTEGPSMFSRTGPVTLQDNVRITQAGRLLRADSAHIDRDAHTGQMTHITLIGHVLMQEHGKLLSAQYAILNLLDDTVELHNVIYRILQAQPAEDRTHASWGTAKAVYRLRNHNILLKKASYSTCSPTSPTWNITGNSIQIDRDNKQAVVKDAVLTFKGVPILYTPYFSLAANHQRRSGLLAPTLATTSGSGVIIGLPLYWNMAPNYDLILTPSDYTKRGLQLRTFFRYINPHNSGSLHLSFLPNDKAFRRFRKQILDTIKSFTEPSDQPYLDALRNSNDHRAHLSFQDNALFSPHWTANLHLNYVTDAYYLRDFGGSTDELIANQLLNQLDVQYASTHWKLGLLLQAYQTLHLIEQRNDPTVNQYSRLPEVNASAHYPHMLGKIDLDLNAQAVNFDYRSTFPPITDTLPAGQRFHTQPTLSWPLYRQAAGYLTPELSLDTTAYHVLRPSPIQAAKSTRIIPIFDIDSGLFFSRPIQWAHHQYTQTLEPRVFFLYVPFKNQDQYPVYDTQISPFIYEQLFARNRFSGFDRLQNAQQISMGFTSRLLEGPTATQRLVARFGTGYDFGHPKVCLTPHCPIQNGHWMPVATALSYYLSNHWSVRGDAAWDPQTKQADNLQLNLNYYGNNSQQVIGAGYAFVQAATPVFDAPPSFFREVSLYHLHFSWPLTQHWSTSGYLDYNASERHPENYSIGLQYNACCWSFRVIAQRAFIGIQPNTIKDKKYNNSYFLEFQLKGLGGTTETTTDGQSGLVDRMPHYSKVLMPNGI